MKNSTKSLNQQIMTALLNRVKLDLKLLKFFII